MAQKSTPTAGELPFVAKLLTWDSDKFRPVVSYDRVVAIVVNT